MYTTPLPPCIYCNYQIHSIKELNKSNMHALSLRIKGCERADLTVPIHCTRKLMHVGYAFSYLHCTDAIGMVYVNETCNKRVIYGFGHESVREGLKSCHKTKLFELRCLQQRHHFKHFAQDHNSSHSLIYSCIKSINKIFLLFTLICNLLLCLKCFVLWTSDILIISPAPLHIV